MFFIGFNRKWSSTQPGQRKLAVFGSLFYTCMLVQTQLPDSFGKHMRFCFQQDVNVTAVMNTAIFSFNIVFTGAKKERKWKPPLDLNRSEVQWKQDAAVVWSGLVWFDTFLHQCVANWRQEMKNETSGDFCAFNVKTIVRQSESLLLAPLSL